LTSSSNTIRGIESSRRKKIHRVFFEKYEGKRRVGNLGIVEGIILK
jgi:hypothetical protein